MEPDIARDRLDIQARIANVDQGNRAAASFDMQVRITYVSCLNSCRRGVKNYGTVKSLNSKTPGRAQHNERIMGHFRCIVNSANFVAVGAGPDINSVAMPLRQKAIGI
jgi:hypothetical protein